MNGGFLNEVLLWGTLIQWMVISALFFADSLRVHVRTRREYAAARPLANGRALVGRYRHAISRWFVIGSGIGLILGILSVYRFIAHPQPLPQEVSIITAIVREGIVFMFFAFWRAKRLNLELYRQVDFRHHRAMTDLGDEHDKQLGLLGIVKADNPDTKPDKR